MEPHQKDYVRPADLLFMNHDNSDASAPPDEHMKDSNTLEHPHDDTTTTGAAHQSKQVTTVTDPRLNHSFYAELLLSRTASGGPLMPLVFKHSIVHTGNLLRETSNAVSPPVDAPDGVLPDGATTTSLQSPLKDPHNFGAMLHTYQNTTSEEIKQIIGCLVNLDLAITRQSRLNELHEAHTAKNFREQRHLNKDRKLRLRETVRSTHEKLTSLDAQRMGQDIIIKQHEIRANSHQHQLKGLQERVQMLAQGGEWAETEVNELKQTLADAQGQVKSLELSNVGLIDQVWSLKEEVHALREKEKVWERRLAALERTAKDQNKSQLMDVCVKKEQVLNAASSAVGNGRIFSIRL